MPVQTSKRLSDPQHRGTYIDEDAQEQQFDIRRYDGEKSFVCYHRSIVAAFVGLMVLSGVLVTYFVVSASSDSTSASHEDISRAAETAGIPSFLAEMGITKQDVLDAEIAEDEMHGASVSFQQFVAASIDVDDEEAWMFDNYRSSFEKEYDTTDEYLYRRAVFAYNNAKAKELNENAPLARFGWTKFSDWTSEEFQTLNGFKMTSDDMKIAKVVPQISNDLVKELRNPERRRATVRRSEYCEDSTDGATDSYGDGCEWYDRFTAWCGVFDDSDFNADEMCCVCGGGNIGSDEPTATPTREPDFTPTDEPTAEPVSAQPTPSPVMPSPDPTMPPIDGMNINWVDLGMTTGVKNQGSCGSCWAFAATECLESAMLISNTEHAGDSLSEQEMVSCSTGAGCSGGWPMSAWYWVQSSTNGQCTETVWPYTASDESCSKNVNTIGESDAKPTGVYTATSWCYNQLCEDQYLQEPTLAQNLITYGVINVNIHANTAWSYYQGGVMDAETCGGDEASDSGNVDHAVILVGINSDADVPYWIVQNSWGTNWGDDGFIYLKYGENTCGIANYPGLVIV